MSYTPGTSTLSTQTDQLGVATLTFPSLAAQGLHSVSAQYAGGAGLAPSSSSSASTSIYQRVSLLLAQSNGVAGEPIDVSASLVTFPGGVPVVGAAINFGFGAVVPSQNDATDASGIATVTTTIATPGSYTVTASFFDPAGFYADSTGAWPLQAETDSAPLEVAIVQTQLSALSVAGHSYVGETIPATITLSRITPPIAPIQGATITFTLTGPSGAITQDVTTDQNGAALAFFPLTLRGAHTLSAAYAGNASTQPVSSNTANVGVYQRTNVTITANPSVPFGEPLDVTATLTTVPGGTPIIGASITLAFGSGVSGDTGITNANGQVLRTVTYPTAGVRTIIGSFSSGAAFYTNAAGSVPPAATVGTHVVDVTAATTALTAPNLSGGNFIGEPLIAQAILTRTSAPASPLNGQTVSFTLSGPSGNVVISNTTDQQGMAAVSFPGPAQRGAYTVTVSFEGTSVLLPATSSPTNHAVYDYADLTTSVATGYAGDPITVSATLVTLGGGTPIEGQEVTFAFAGVIPSQTATTNAAGVASVSVVFAAAGDYEFSATFDGAADFYTNSTGAIPPQPETASSMVQVAIVETWVSPVTAPPVVKVGQNMFMARLTRVTAPSALLAGQVVTFTFTSPTSLPFTQDGTTDENGDAVIDFFVGEVGFWTVSASFAGTGGLTPANGATEQFIANP